MLPSITFLRCKVGGVRARPGALNKVLHAGEGGGGLFPEVQPLTLLHTILKKVPVSCTFY